MELRRLRLVNFRQHADTEIEFGHGITGIVGPNGAGKSTLLEAIAWAIYGSQAARGDKDSVRNLRAKARSSVKVELELTLGRHELRVVRGLHSAELYQDGVLLANSLKEVTEKAERALGMTHDEFFNTYFTGQKDLAVMGTLKREERHAFLSRVLGYERLDLARTDVRETRNALNGELKGLEAGLVDRAALEKARQDAEARLAEARGAVRSAEKARADAEKQLGDEAPRWKDWQARRDRTLSLDGDRRIAEKEVESARQEFQRLDRELAAARDARRQLDQLEPTLAPIHALEREQTQLDALQKEEVARRADEAQLKELRRATTRLDQRLTELLPAEEALATVEREATLIAEELAAAERLAEEARSAWVRDRQYAETKRNELREQWKDVKQERDQIVALGPEGICPTCKRPLGPEYAQVLTVLDAQLSGIKDNGEFFARRVEQLEAAPAGVTEAEKARDEVVGRSRAVSERAGKLRAEAEERRRAVGERETASRRSGELEQRLATRSTGYDPARHDQVRAQLAALKPVLLEATTLRDRAGRGEILVKEAELAEKVLSTREVRARELTEAVHALGFSEADFDTARQRHERAQAQVRSAEVQLAQMRGELTGAESALAEARRREAERGEKERQVSELRMRLRLHNELDRALGDLRTSLNAAMRPEIATLASGFLGDLTDGRYADVELTEDYRVMVLDEEIPKPVLSGGEEDLANLVLRLAISQMIAERAGQPLSLLVLDEIFGSLDDNRRQHVLTLLRRLGDRFPQVILITHVESIRDGLDRVIRVDYDAGRGTSVVRDDTATLGGADAGVAA
ncbi:MAG TPA: SMC family ATPase [Gemmatimonadales bacterium]|nr:SMC family ATPase [Gemmatimonadales bacterium]